MFEPPEQSLASGVRKWSPQRRLARAGRLTDDHDVAGDWSARDRRGLHSRTAPALAQTRDVLRERELAARRGKLFQNRRKIDNKTLSTMLRIMQVTIGK